MSLDANGWLSLISLVGGGAMGTKVVYLLIETRDSLRDLMRDVGNKEPATGLFRKVDDLAIAAGEHREWLVRAGLDRRNDERRHQ